MIYSILDTDLYKISMQKAVCKLFPRSVVSYRFINRGKTEFPPGFGEELQRLVDDTPYLGLTGSEYDFLREKCPYLDQAYLDFLRGYRFNPAEVAIHQFNGGLHVEITGLWYRTILWEVPLMAMISELYFKMTKAICISPLNQEEINRTKFQGMKNMGVRFMEFGTRRRFSYDVQDRVVKDAGDFRGTCVGTSNPHLAMKHGWVPMGTQAHEWFQFHAAYYGYGSANRMAMENWVNVYEGDLGIVLPDTFTTEAFLKSFSTKFAKLYDGGRQDSGDALAWTEMWTSHYRKLRIDPMTKNYIYSDGISSLEQVRKIHTHYVNTVCGGERSRFRDSFGIGTWLTNDCSDVKPLNIVIKMQTADGKSVVKLSDSPTKNTGNPDQIRLCKDVLVS